MADVSLRLAEESSGNNDEEDGHGGTKTCGSEKSRGTWTSYWDSTSSPGFFFCCTRKQKLCVLLALIVCLCVSGLVFHLVFKMRQKSKYRAGRALEEQEKKKLQTDADFETIPENDVWEAYCSKHPRTLEPKAQRELARCGVPDVMRLVFWAKFIGIKGPKTNDIFLGPTVPAWKEAAFLPQLATRRNDTVIKLEKEKARSPVQDKYGRWEAVMALEAWKSLFPWDRSLPPSGWKPDFADQMGPPNTTMLETEEKKMVHCHARSYLAWVLMMVFHDAASVDEAGEHLVLNLGVEDWYAEDGLMISVDTIVLKNVLRSELPSVASVFRSKKYKVSMLIYKWFLPLFSMSLEGEGLRRVWDLIIYDGIQAVFRVALAMIAQEAEMLRRCKTATEVFLVMQDWRLVQAPGALIQAAYAKKYDGIFEGKALAKHRHWAAKKIIHKQALSRKSAEALLQRFPLPETEDGELSGMF